MAVKIVVIALATVYFTRLRSIDSYSTTAQSSSNLKNRIGLHSEGPETLENPFLSSQIVIGEEIQPTNKGWHRRLWSKVTMTRSSENLSNIITSDEGIAQRYLQAQDAFILNTFETDDPMTLFHQHAPLSHQVTENLHDEDQSNTETDSPFVRFTRKTFEKVLTERLDKWSKGMNSNVNVECDPTSNILQFLRGQFHCDATINLDRIVFDNFQVSGGQLQAKNFCLNLFSFVPVTLPLATTPRYPNQFDLVAHNMTLTEKDLWESSCIRNGLRRLMTRVLKQKGLTAVNVSIQSIKILSTGKLSCIGQATSLFGPPIMFELRTGIGIAGHGHILTLPGLEVAIYPALGFFVTVIPELTIDLGHNAQLLDIVVDGTNALVKVSASVTITPEHTLQLKEYIQSSKSFGAHCFVDVGRWLTRIGRFAK